ncbi:MAG: hypothetical protein CL493_04300 [Actinobacteria bacterium]|nr:hypothetical protein [Actinomycetota bacterium]
MNTNIFLMSGSGLRFKKNNYKVPKQFLKINNGNFVIDEIIANSPKTEENIFVINNELEENEIYKEWVTNLQINSKIYNVGNITNGQATSLYSVRDIVNRDSKLFVLPCDTVIYDKKIKSIFNLQSDHAIVTSKPTNYQLDNNLQFGWVQDLDEKIEIFCKETPTFPLNSNVILGFFYYKNFSIFESGYTKLIESQKTINGEYYLDKITELLIADQATFQELNVNRHLSFGTPKEYEKNKNV